MVPTLPDHTASYSRCGVRYFYRCIPIPMLVGLYFGNLSYGLLGSTAGLVILYLPSTTIAHRMITMLACSFGFMISFAIGIIFSSDPYVSSLLLGILTFGVQWVSNYFKMKPLESFFFLMFATIASCMTFDLSSIPTRIGVVGMGAMLACILAFIYSLYIV